MKKGSGIELFDIGSPEGFFDTFETQIKTAFDDVQIMTPVELAPFELAGFKFNNNVVRVTSKTGGNTNPDGYTIVLRYGSNNSKLVKRRFL